jgi:hypothetical protein
MLRLITDGKISPEEAVRAYHGILQSLKIKPKLALEKDLELTDQAMSYGGGASRSRVTVSKPVTALNDRRPHDDRNGGHRPTPQKDHSCGCPTPTCECPDTKKKSAFDWPKTTDGSPDFPKMSPPQRRAYHRARLAKKFR